MIRLFIPDPDAYFLPIPVPYPGIKKAPDPGSGSATLSRNQGFFKFPTWKNLDKNINKLLRIRTVCGSRSWIRIMVFPEPGSATLDPEPVGTKSSGSGTLIYEITGNHISFY
jgi:hypothetical protein